MVGDPHEEDDRSAKSTEEAALSARLRRLGDRLDHGGPGRPTGNEPRSRATSDPSALARAMRLSAELVGGVIAGAGLGWGLDYLLGSKPWGFIVLTLLGFAGGVLSVMRSAGVIPERKL